MSDIPGRLRTLETTRHRTSFIDAGPDSGPLIFFIHGWPELGILWRHQLEYFASAGWHCIAPDMRGYGKSAVPTEVTAYAMREIVHDMAELHDSLGSGAAVWVGHDWGSPVVSALAANEAGRCRGVVNICVPYFPRGFGLAELLPLVDRGIYPLDRFPLGQWDYMQFHIDEPERTAREFDADPAAFLTMAYQSGTPEGLADPAFTASIRANGGWFGDAGRAPHLPRDPAVLSDADFEVLVEAFATNGFRGPDNWYLNFEANRALASTAPDAGHLSMPVLMVHGAWDNVCETVNSRLTDPMRAACSDLTEVVIDAGHWVAQERPTELNRAITDWLEATGITSASPEEVRTR